MKNGKLAERLGRKATGLNQEPFLVDCRVTIKRKISEHLLGNHRRCFCFFALEE